MQSIPDENGGILITPSIDSIVLIARIEDSDEMWCVVQCAAADSIEINDGVNGGLVNIKELTQWMTTVKADLEAIAGALKGLGAPIVITTQSPNEKLEDKKITH